MGEKTNEKNVNNVNIYTVEGGGDTPQSMQNIACQEINVESIKVTVNVEDSSSSFSLTFMTRQRLRKA